MEQNNCQTYSEQDLNKVKKLFTEDSSIEEHISYRRFNNDIYWYALENIFEKKIELNTCTYSKILAISIQNKEKEKVEYLCKKDEYKLIEILRCCEILDSKRAITLLNKKLHMLTKNNARSKKINKIKSLISNKETINEGCQFSLSASKIKMIINYWIKNIDEEKLKFYAISYGTKYWKFLIDLLHTKPSHFKLSWFQNYVFTGNAPEDSIIHRFKNLNSNNIIDFINKYKPFYNYLRTLENIHLTDEAKRLICEYTPIETILFYWHELNCNQVAELISSKIENAVINLPYGNLLDNIIKMDKYHELKNKLLVIANEKITKYKLTLEKPVVILCDGSSSMDIAIKTSAIVSSILTAICQAQLRVFRSQDELIKNPPRTAEDAILFSKYCHANNCTNPASSIYPYYANKIEVKTFIVITDEEENEKVNNMNFADIFKKYREEIYKSKIIFISFIKNRNNHMQMIYDIKNKINNVEEDILQFTFDFHNPDLRRLDNILGQISTLE